MRIAAIILGILGLICALFGPLLAGWIGGLVAILFALAAGILGFLVRKKEEGKGLASIILGAIAVILAVSMIAGTANTMKLMKDRLMDETNMNDGKFRTVAKYVEHADTNTGLLGFATSIARHVTEEDQAAVEEEMKSLSELLNEKKN